MSPLQNLALPKPGQHAHSLTLPCTRWVPGGVDGCPRKFHSREGEICKHHPGNSSLCQQETEVWTLPGKRRAGVLCSGSAGEGTKLGIRLSCSQGSVGVLMALPGPSLMLQRVGYQGCGANEAGAQGRADNRGQCDYTLGWKKGLIFLNSLESSVRRDVTWRAKIWKSSEAKAMAKTGA